MPDLTEKAVDLGFTVALIALCVGLFWYGRAISARPADPANPRMLPWNLILIVVAFVALLAVVHLVNLFGYETGARLR